MTDNRIKAITVDKSCNLPPSSKEVNPQNLYVDIQPIQAVVHAGLEQDALSSTPKVVEKKNLNRKRGDGSSDSSYKKEVNKLKKAKKADNKNSGLTSRIDADEDLIDLNSSLIDSTKNSQNTQVFNTSAGDVTIEENSGSITINNNNAPKIVIGNDSNQPLPFTDSDLADLFQNFICKSALDKLEVIAKFMDFCKPDNLVQVRSLIKGVYNSFSEEKKNSKNSFENSIKVQLNTMANNMAALSKNLSTKIENVEKQLNNKVASAHQTSIDLCENIKSSVDKAVKKNLTHESPLVRELTRIKRDLHNIKCLQVRKSLLPHITLTIFVLSMLVIVNMRRLER